MIEITDLQLKAIMPKLADGQRQEYLPFLNSALQEFEINTGLRAAAFLAQLAHESGELTRWVENLNYSAKRLTAVWPKRFPTLAIARQYERNPEKLANFVYANRMGNGDVASGDGYRFRGRSPLQLTGRANYAEVGAQVGVDLIARPELAELPQVGFRIAGNFWKQKGLSELADAQNFRRVTEIINGGLNGLTERQQYFQRAKKVLGV